MKKKGIKLLLPSGEKYEPVNNMDKYIPRMEVEFNSKFLAVTEGYTCKCGLPLNFASWEAGPYTDDDHVYGTNYAVSGHDDLLTVRCSENTPEHDVFRLGSINTPVPGVYIERLGKCGKTATGN